MNKGFLSPKKHLIFSLIILCCFIISVICLNYLYIPDKTTVRVSDMNEIDYLTFEKDLEAGKITNIYYGLTSEYVFVEEETNTIFKLPNLVDSDFEKQMI